MKVVFYSEHCDYCKKLLAYLDKYGIKSLFKLVNIDKVTAPKDIDIVPTIIDTELNQPLKGKKAFEYLLNIKYFNNPTNNIDYIKDIPINPNIPEDDKAIKSKTLNLEINTQSQNVQDDFNEVFKSAIRNTDESILFNQQTRQPIKFEFDSNQEIEKNNNKQLNKNNQQNDPGPVPGPVQVPVPDPVQVPVQVPDPVQNDSLEFHETNSNNTVATATHEMVNARQIQDKKLSVLMQMKRR